MEPAVICSRTEGCTAYTHRETEVGLCVCLDDPGLTPTGVTVPEVLYVITHKAPLQGKSVYLVSTYVDS